MHIEFRILETDRLLTCFSGGVSLCISSLSNTRMYGDVIVLRSGMVIIFMNFGANFCFAMYMLYCTRTYAAFSFSCTDSNAYNILVLFYKCLQKLSDMTVYKS